MDLTHLVEWGFLSLLTGAVTFSARNLAQISRNISDLNARLSAIVEKVGWHEKSLESHDARIRGVEIELYTKK